MAKTPEEIKAIELDAAESVANAVCAANREKEAADRNSSSKPFIGGKQYGHSEGTHVGDMYFKF
ncbi:hypothetical protein [Streptomyces sp. NPDC046821]|uniref:hypothetical protein n=1 Tax=Streptomyces sp. NPDC046821 TaxID=3154702 RepID=UPI0033F9F910